ncbi:diguanylate phosphodiesterase [Cohnella xylanilytica]|uniref:ABC transporter substrate-binding protein n=1 Tax=Cohnella xylanilytica TaxID=557555 RepID=UPI001B1ABE29|nr:ABC transporter substrate-binding protein [Cohnella xylanilytica]GIO15345.1 diguanylate phosphodiesterase [Cohnella xylanilytica]
MRKTFKLYPSAAKLLAVLIAAAAFLSACGGNNANNNGAASPSGSNSPSAPASESASASGESASPSSGAATDSAGGKDGGQVVVVIPQDIDYLDPHLAVAAGTSEVLFNIFEGLLKPNSKGELQPAIAESYEISPDGLTYTFKLRDGVKFHNGNPVTSADVKYSYDRLAGKDTGKPLLSSFASVDTIETPDDKTVVIKLKENNTSFLTALTSAVIPKDYQDSNKKPIGTGPFKFKEYAAGQKIVLEKNPDYYVKGLPHLDQVEFRIITDAEAAYLAFKSGEIDLYPRIGTEKLAELGDEFGQQSGPQNLVQELVLNNAKKPFDDIRVRQAINYAIDKDEIIQGVALGQGLKVGSHLSSVLKQYYQEGLEDLYKTDVEKAKSLLAEAGYKDGLNITISVPSVYPFHVNTAQVIAQQLEKAGIKAKIESVEWAVWLDRIYKGRDYESTIIAFDGKLNPYDILNKFLSDAPNDFFNYKNPEYDKTLKSALTEVDETKRADLYKKAQTILAQDAAAVFIQDIYASVAYKKNLAGYQLYPIYVQDLSTLYWEK